MANPGFFNANQYRDYPFRSRVSPLTDDEWSASASISAADLPQACIVDFGAILRPAAEFATATGFVYLRSVSRSGGVISITMSISSLPHLYDITFSINTATIKEFHTQWQDSSPRAASGSATDCDESPVWSAYIVTGDLTEWVQQLGDGETIIFATGLWQVIPSRLQNLASTQVQAITLANIQRTLVTPTADCDDGSAAESPTLPIAHLVHSCMVGDIKLYEGYNCGMRYDLRDNSIVISASPGAGAGTACEDFPAYPDEEKPAGSPYYSGGPACADVVKYVNGASSPDLQIKAGPGFSVIADADNPNTLIIERSLSSSIVCIDPALAEDAVVSSSVSVSLSSASVGET